MFFNSSNYILTHNTNERNFYIRFILKKTKELICMQVVEHSTTLCYPNIIELEDFTQGGFFL